MENLLGGVDRLLHRDALRGWGQSAAVDPFLLVPSGFEGLAGRERFRHAVNPRFGDSRAASILLRSPMRVTLDVTVELGMPADLRRLRRALVPPRPRGAPARATPVRPTPESLTNTFLRNTSSLYAEVIAASDSLLLTDAQLTALRQLDSTFSAHVIALYSPLGAYLATLDADAADRRGDRQDALARIGETERAYWPVFWEQPARVAAVLTPTQQRLLPWLAALVAVSPAQRETARWYSGYSVQLPRAR